MTGPRDKATRTNEDIPPGAASSRKSFFARAARETRTARAHLFPSVFRARAVSHRAPYVSTRGYVFRVNRSGRAPVARQFVPARRPNRAPSRRFPPADRPATVTRPRRPAATWPSRARSARAGPTAPSTVTPATIYCNSGTGTVSIKNEKNQL